MEPLYTLIWGEGPSNETWEALKTLGAALSPALGALATYAAYWIKRLYEDVKALNAKISELHTAHHQEMAGLLRENLAALQALEYHHDEE